MKIEVTNENQYGYPCIKKSNTDAIVLFTKKRCGTVLKTDGRSVSLYEIGYYSETWHEEDSFELFTGSITLSN